MSCLVSNGNGQRRRGHSDGPAASTATGPRTWRMILLGCLASFIPRPVGLAIHPDGQLGSQGREVPRLLGTVEHDVAVPGELQLAVGLAAPVSPDMADLRIVG